MHTGRTLELRRQVELAGAQRTGQLGAGRPIQGDRRGSDRRSQVGSGDRSERIRTYNFPQGRMTDHRINLTLYKLDEVMAGHLDQVIDPLLQEFQAGQLAALGSE